MSLRYREWGDAMDNIRLLVQSLDYIEEHLKENIKTRDIADACYCSKSTLEKLFQYVYAISIHNYIIRRRMTLAAKQLAGQPETPILSIAVEYGYGSHEAFARAFKEVWNCNPSEFRKRRYSELYPRFREPIKEGDDYIMERKSVDISQLYDLFCERRECWFVCCDIQGLIPINDISRKAGDIAIVETMRRMDEEAGEEDIVFRIGGDEFCILTNSTSQDYAEDIVHRIKSHNKETFLYEGEKIPLSLYAVSTKLENAHIKYNELFTGLHLAIKESK